MQQQTLTCGLAIGLLTGTWCGAFAQEVPALNSDYRADHVLYLDFDGHVEPRTSPEHFCAATGAQLGHQVQVAVTPITLDPRDVYRIWAMVAEDFAPFRVNVTTDPRFDPAPSDPRAVRVAIGNSSHRLDVFSHTCERDPRINPPYLDWRITNVGFAHVNPAFMDPVLTAKDVAHAAGHVYGLPQLSGGTYAGDIPIMGYLIHVRDRRHYVWIDQGNGTDAFAHLVSLLGSRTDEPDPAALSSLTTTAGDQVHYGYGLLSDGSDRDGFVFEAGNPGSLEIVVVPGAWTSPLGPEPGPEPNTDASYRIEEDGAPVAHTCAIPLGRATTLPVSAGLPPPGNLCEDPWPLSPGIRYRVVVQDTALYTFPGTTPPPIAAHAGRYTVIVRRVTPNPPPVTPR